MSWMDSWSRPSKSSAIPPPLYLTDPTTKYCSTCGRMIGARRTHSKQKVVKYCSDGCRKHRPGPLDKRIDGVILALLEGREGSGVERTGASGKFRKGDKRVVVTCNEIEEIVFGRGQDGTENAEAAEEADAMGNDGDGEVVSDAEAALSADEGGVTTGEVEGAQSHDEGAAKSSDEMSPDMKRQAGQRRADEREKVKRAARRAVVFGFPIEVPEVVPSKNKFKGGEKEGTTEEPAVRKCEAVVNGRVVEPSYAKGNWAIRWRDD